MSLTVFLFPFLYKKRSADKFTELKPERIMDTIIRLEARISERFPESGLLRVCGEFRELAVESGKLALHLARPIWPVRAVTFASAFLLIALVIWAFGQLPGHFKVGPNGVVDVLQTMESLINELIFLGLALYFLINLETRLKRQSALKALHQLRSIAHVVDMHQLTKDPAHVMGDFTGTKASPQRNLTRPQLARYLDYCSEMQALVSKIAALFAQNMEDPVVLAAVNDLETLTQGLSQNVWQKIMILDLSEPGY